MGALKGYCTECDCWFPIRDVSLSANLLCPCCLQQTSKVRPAVKPLPEAQFRTRRLLGRRRSAEAAGSAE
jgi:hypothetical protein